MIPQLYSGDTLGYPVRRIGGLYQATECLATSEINGEFSLTLKMPVSAAHWENLTRGAVIKAVKDSVSEPENFVIASIGEELDGLISVYAQHESYRYNSVMVSPFLNGGVRRGAQWAYEQAEAHLVNAPAGLTMAYHLSSTALGKPHLLTPTSLRKYLIETLVPDWGGEIVFSGDDIDWVDGIGQDRGARIVYGSNLLTLQIQLSEQDFETGIYPYYGRAGDAQKPLVTIQGDILDYGVSAPITKIIPVDLTSRFESTPTQTELLEEAQRYKNKHKRTTLPQSLALESVRRIGSAPICLGDAVLCICDQLGQHQKHRVRKLVYDVLNEREQSIDIGDEQSTFAKTILGL